MARVTVEDCVLKVPNRFDLVMLAAQRARDISAGASLTVERDNDKTPVVALREIADETIDLEQLSAALILGLQKHVEIDEPEEEEGGEFGSYAPSLTSEAEPGAASAHSDTVGGDDAALAQAIFGERPAAEDQGDTSQ